MRIRITSKYSVTIRAHRFNSFSYCVCVYMYVYMCIYIYIYIYIYICKNLGLKFIGVFCHVRSKKQHRY